MSNTENQTPNDKAVLPRSSQLKNVREAIKTLTYKLGGDGGALYDGKEGEKVLWFLHSRWREMSSVNTPSEMATSLSCYTRMLARLYSAITGTIPRNHALGLSNDQELVNRPTEIAREIDEDLLGGPKPFRPESKGVGIKQK